MKFIADLQIHSKYSRATSPKMVIEGLSCWAKIKGIKVMGTGDFTHPIWLGELKEKLIPAEPGLFVWRDDPDLKTDNRQLATRFMLTAETSHIYSKGGKVRRVHLLIWAPSFEAVEKINTRLSWVGNLKSDGRPIIGMDSKELVKIVLDADPAAMVIPAHCLLPNTLIHTRNSFLTSIQDVKKGQLVFTHKGRWRPVEKVLHRPYKGKVLSIKPYYFRLGLTTTPEHPFFALKTHKNCHWSNGICKPSHEYNSSCTKKYYRQYSPQWIPAGRLGRGDVLLFPRFLHAYVNHSVIAVDKIAETEVKFSSGSHVWGGGTRSFRIPKRILVTKEFCRLTGYFLAEGYVNGRDAMGFTFHKDEQEYIQDVAALMKHIFGIADAKKRTLSGNGVEMTFYSRIVQELFAHLCYASREHSAATKAMPLWMLGLAPELQVEIFRGWWRGDKGYTSSRALMNQIKVILLRLGIIPSIYEDTREKHRVRGHHYFGDREIRARYPSYGITRLSFFVDTFDLLREPEFMHFRSRSDVRHGWVDERYIYLPIRDIETNEYDGQVYNLEVEEDGSYVSEFATVHNCWTPWFSVFGSMSGFDSLAECFDELTPQIRAIETGLSSDPGMNWRLSQLDNVAIVSNSDSHSLERIGREANVFDAELSYEGIVNAVKSKDPSKFLFTIEFFPEEGKYHYDGHRLCGTRMSPIETKKYGGKCPKCKRSVTVGVMARVEELADRPVGYVPEGAIPYKNLVPFDEIIAEALGVQSKTKKVYAIYHKLCAALGGELPLLLDGDLERIAQFSDERIAEGMRRVREGKLEIAPGYDGEYGKIKIFNDKEPISERPQASFF